MKTKKYKYFVGDFETTVYKGQTDTSVWASAVVPLYSEDVEILHSIGETLDYLISLKENVIIYYHNLSFDGSFWLSHLLVDKKWQQALRPIKRINAVGEEVDSFEWLPEKEMINKSFKYSISNRGQWYSIIIKVNDRFIEIRDSLKLIPLSVKKIGDSFGTKHHKLEMEYEGFRYPGCTITEEEQRYIKNDVLVVKEALEIMFDQGHDKLTIGSNCLAEYKRLCRISLINTFTYDEMYPNLYNIKFDEEQQKVHNAKTAGDWIRKSYKGGWCYLVKGKEKKMFHDGCTADVNSLYPSMMHSESGNRYPIGLPHFWQGDFIPETAIGDNKYYFIRVQTRFDIKKGKLPFIQIKDNAYYSPTECLTTSDVLIEGEYRSHLNGHMCTVEMTMTMTDYQLFREHYNVSNFKIIDGCWFYTQTGIFDEYINKYKKIKTETTSPAIRTIAKLFQNNLYGKMASNTDSSWKMAYVKEDNSIGFTEIVEYNKEPGYIAVGSAITSYSRNFTIRAAQNNFYGVYRKGFIYADTDSIHCDLPKEELKGITIHPANYCCWKIESEWDDAWFTRQKTYIEHVVKKDGKEVDEPYNDIKCAGMPQKCKDLLNKSFEGDAVITDYNDPDEIHFLFNDKVEPIKRTYRDFKEGLNVPGKLMPKRIQGGVLLVNTTYEMR